MNESPSMQNKRWANVNFTGTLAIVTIVSGPYQWYLPLWAYCIKKEIPEADAIAYIRGIREPIPEDNFKLIINPDLNTYPMDGFTTAALRFVYDDPLLKSYDYVLITDCDILINKEHETIINQHMRMCMRFNLQCYHNYISQWVDDKPKSPGVHFVTNKWWEVTKYIREEYAKDLWCRGSRSWEWDELMLARIILESGLPKPPEEMHIWAHHGVHLGDYRRRIMTKHNGRRPEAPHGLFIKQLLNDKKFMDLLETCSKHKELYLREIFDYFKSLYDDHK